MDFGCHGPLVRRGSAHFFEMMKAADLVVGLIATVGSVAVGAILWAVRVRSGVTAEISESLIGDREKLEGVAERVSNLEIRMEWPLEFESYMSCMSSWQVCKLR